MEKPAWGGDMAPVAPRVDAAHRALLEQTQLLLEGPDQSFPAGMARLTEALEDDFRREEQLMETIDYPAICSHREQHARVLATLHQLAPEDIPSTRRAVGLLLPWFELHLATADAALAIALQMAERLDDSGQAGRPAAAGAPQSR